MILLVNGNATHIPLPSNSVHCVVTSPPYWGMRKYADVEPTLWPEVTYKPMSGIPAMTVPAARIAMGFEPTLKAFIGHLVTIFREIRRVLREDGTCWLNLGDGYCGSGRHNDPLSSIQRGNSGSLACALRGVIPPGLKAKDIAGVPWRAALALQADGWWLRSDVIWHKPNPMPESAKDRPTKAHEYLFLLTKNQQYFYDHEAVKESSIGQRRKRNRRTVWTIPPKPYPGAHYATFPPDLVEPCIKAGTSAKGCCSRCGSPWTPTVEKTFHRTGLPKRHISGHTGPGVGWEGVPRGYNHTNVTDWQPTCSCDTEPIPCTVLDPFAGTGTTGVVARQLGRHAVLLDLSHHYLTEEAKSRLELDRFKEWHKGNGKVHANLESLPLFA